MTEARTGNPKRVRVLIVDDSATLREGLTSLCSLLSELEVVGTASNGEEALEAIRNLKPDIVSLDIRMPKMGGVEVLKTIKRDRLACTPIILSGMVDDFAREKCLKLGARYVFNKSTDLDKFLRVLGRSRKARKFPSRTKGRAPTRSGSGRKLKPKPVD